MRGEEPPHRLTTVIGASLSEPQLASWTVDFSCIIFLYDWRVIVAVVVLHQLNIRTCTAQIVHKLYCNVSMMLWSKHCNKVCELFEQCMSKYRAGICIIFIYLPYVRCSVNATHSFNLKNCACRSVRAKYWKQLSKGSTLDLFHFSYTDWLSEASQISAGARRLAMAKGAKGWETEGEGLYQTCYSKLLVKDKPLYSEKEGKWTLQGERNKVAVDERQTGSGKIRGDWKLQ